MVLVVLGGLKKRSKVLIRGPPVFLGWRCFGVWAFREPLGAEGGDRLRGLGEMGWVSWAFCFLVGLRGGGDGDSCTVASPVAF